MKTENILIIDSDYEEASGFIKGLEEVTCECWKVVLHENNKIYGDVKSNVYDKCSYITPVPGGVGPMTVIMLVKNTFEAYKKQNGIVDMFDLGW